MRHILAFIHLIFLLTPLWAQTTFPENGVQDERDGAYAFTNATIHTDYKTTIESGTLVIRDGKVEAVGQVLVPKDAIVIDLEGYHIYPSFIELYSNYGQPEPKKPEGNSWDNPPQFISNKKGAYGWNQAIKPEVAAHKAFRVNNKQVESYLNLGFGAILSHHTDGIARGTGALVALSNKEEHESIIIDQASAHYSFDKGTSTQDYPGSLMGAIALLRQSYLDADWYAKAGKDEQLNLSLSAWNQIQDLPQFFSVKDKLSIFRADKVGDEFGVQYIIRGSGEEYQRVEAVKATNAPMVIPVNYPKPYDVEDPLDALNVSLADMKHWEMAPANALFLQEAGIPFAFTTDGLEEKKGFLANVQKAVEYGLPKEEAIKALTHTPASLLNATDRVGSLKKGTLANFLITSGEMFEKETKMLENWVQGEKHVLTEFDYVDVRGTYDLKVGTQVFKLSVAGDLYKPAAKILIDDSTDIKVAFSRTDNLITLSFNPEKKAEANQYRLSGMMNGKDWSGKGQLPAGSWIEWTASYKGLAEEKEEQEEEKKDEKPEYGDLIFPFEAYGNQTLLQPEKVLLKNATVWTNEADGILQHTDVLIENGKIVSVGTNLSAEGAKTVDASGKHVTSGIIDEHSHIAISRGVNEWTQASSAEVSIADVVNSEDINLYRQLAGGVTAAQLLHGSANPIGGQSALIKFRWGLLPEEMKIEGADGFIKFALGENVKQANWGDKNTVRFPQTRMGVEQVFFDHFTRALEYQAEWKNHIQYVNDLPKKKRASAIAPRRDIELDVILEIIERQRFITCHSYVQSEINMLMKTAEHFNFRINTFTHILEGYKVADKMKAHGVNASTFADWWAYKYEVIDAIPYNAAILSNAGVNTAINSDDAEMGRRLNQEAAKGVKYGGMSEEEAWKMVTLNPAKMLHLDDRMGSIKAGKDADIVIWSDNPLSIYAKVEKTYVDGVCYYDEKIDEEKREQILAERARLIQKMIGEKQGGGETQKPSPKYHHLWHCDDVEDYSTFDN